MSLLRKQLFDLKPTHEEDPLKSIELERVDDDTIAVRRLEKEKVKSEMIMDLHEYEQFIAILTNSKFIYAQNNK